jgi:transglutaminase-like putative cysteine protease
MHAVRDRVDYRAGATDVEATAASVLQKGEGVCQDHAHVYCAAARSAGVPARYVSGYLFAGDPGAAASHAWVEAYDGERWIGLDPANRALAVETYVRLAVGLDYRDAAPIVGARTGGGGERMKVEVSVEQ